MTVQDDYPLMARTGGQCDAPCLHATCRRRREMADALDEVARLRQWKAEADEVLAAWEGVWMIAGQPWRRGETQAQAVAREVQHLRSQNAAWMNGVADIVEPWGYDRQAASGPADLLPGLTSIAERLRECVEARRYLYERVALNKRVDHVD